MPTIVPRRTLAVLLVTGLGLGMATVPASADPPVRKATSHAAVVGEQGHYADPYQVSFPPGGSVDAGDWAIPGHRVEVTNGRVSATGNTRTNRSAASVVADELTLVVSGAGLGTILRGRLTITYTDFRLDCTARGSSVRTAMSATAATATYTPSDVNDPTEPYTFDLPTTPEPNTVVERDLPGLGGQARIQLNTQDRTRGAVSVVGVQAGFSAGNGDVGKLTCGPNTPRPASGE